MKQFIIILLASLAVSCMQEQTLIVDFKGFEGNEVEVTIQDYSEYFAGRKSKLARTYTAAEGCRIDGRGDPSHPRSRIQRCQ